MKKMLLVACIAFVASCTQKEEKKDPVSADTKMAEPVATATEKIDYPYVIDHIPDWQAGDPQNSLKALKALKAYENGNMEESAGYFGDSVHFSGEKYDEHLSNDGLKAMFLKDKQDGHTITVKMDDWESVKSKDGKEEWVSLWYKQLTRDKTGKVDSAEVMDDLRFKDGKIIVLDEKTRHYAVAKKM